MQVTQLKKKLVIAADMTGLKSEVGEERSKWGRKKLECGKRLVIEVLGWSKPFEEDYVAAV